MCSSLRQKRKTYEKEQLQNKYDRLARLKTNLDLLVDIYIDQNAFENTRLNVRVASSPYSSPYTCTGISPNKNASLLQRDDGMVTEIDLEC